MIYPIIFETIKGNRYIYDNNTGCVIPANNYVDKLDDNNILYDENVLEKIKEDYPSLPLFEVTSLEEEQNKIIENSKEYLNENGIKEISLIVTEQCNFRCKYCIYSEEYSYSRNHSKKMMDWATAKKAIDYYFQFNKRSLPYNPTLTPCVGFYGGEALLNWELVKKVTDYVETMYRNDFNTVLYTITTNGSLLDKEKIESMINHNFFINISLDGNKKNHDRNRVFESGNPTYETVVKKIELLDKLCKDYNGTKNPIFNFLMTYDNECDMEEIHKSACENEEFYEHFLKISKVSDIDTTYYNNQKSGIHVQTQIKKLIEDFVKQKEKRSKISELLFKQDVVLPAFNKQMTLNPLYGTCIPGNKIAVTVDGEFYMCEKIDYRAPIGNVEEGIDYKRQSEYLEEFIQARKDKCQKCNISSLCYQCFATCGGNTEKFSVNEKACRALRKTISEKFALYYSAREIGIDIL